MKPLILAIVLAVSSALLSFQGTPLAAPEKGVVEKVGSGSAEKTETTQKHQDTTPNVTMIVKQENTPADKSTEKQQDENVEIQGKLVKFTAWLVIVGLLQALILAGTIWAIVHQTSATRKSQRAWVIVSAVEKAPALGFIPEPGDRLDLVGRNSPNVFLAAIKNVGETPATLIKSKVIYQYVARLQDIPDDPDYGNLNPLNNMILVKGDSIGEAAFLQPDRILTRSQADAVRIREAFIYAYGIIKYRDAFEAGHETCFGFLYRFTLGGDPRPVGFVREELPPKYNRAT